MANSTPSGTTPSPTTTSALHGVGAVLDRHGDRLGDRCATLEVAEDRAVPPVVGRLVDQRPQRTVVQGEHVVAPGLLPPQRDHLRQALGLRGSQVVGLREVLRHVVELPDVVVEGGVGIEAVVVHRADGVERHRLPSVVEDGPGAEHLEVLGHVRGRGVRTLGTEQVGEAGAVDAGLGDALDVRGRGDPHQLEHARQDVDGVGELVADAARRRAESGPAS